VLDLLGQVEEAAQLRRQFEDLRPTGTTNRCLLAWEYLLERRPKEALPLLEEARRQMEAEATRPPAANAFWTYYLLGIALHDLDQPGEAVAQFNACLALRPGLHRAYYHRGLAQMKRHQFDEALADFDKAIELQRKQGPPTDALGRRVLADALLQRAILVRERTELIPDEPALRQAIEDVGRALELECTYTLPYYIRAELRERLKDFAGGQRDREEGFGREATDEDSWNTRGYARVRYLEGWQARLRGEGPAGLLFQAVEQAFEQAQFQQALTEFRQAERLNPRSFHALENQVHVLSEDLGQTDQALAILNQALAYYQDSPILHGGRGTLLARLGRRDEALKDAELCLARSDDAMLLFQVAGIYALTSRQNPEDRQEAFRLLSLALKKGFGYDLVESDPDLGPLHRDPRFRRIAEAVQALRATEASGANR
jgi:tetratricopeptide (TPR) repeat protein